ncbi:acyl-CoA dehydrogenase family protein [Mycetocola reblochoni]|uniref:Acyl-CoA dehydrogenase n=2 Tax=Mycetocola reblochoni TaxID=331618 RepID=A0A3L6ZM43_9MICO|nr:acyl-CoA dehydrogenase family protein [Mycetocola reblochoni]RLP68970.1 acyl-CoA dehydrogenase [Mycetocola reblochoni]SJN18726.1 Acyl-CoA dehydrogenase; probable dibenzothiophene desulfurization enzyme [Mycetocola reblochoni REB411]
MPAAATTPRAADAAEPSAAAHRRRVELDELTEARGSGLLHELRERFATAIATIRSDAVADDRDGRLQNEGMRALVDSGFTRLRVPAADGGIDVPLVELFALLSDLGAADPGVANALRGHFSFIEILRQQSGIPPEVRDHWIGEIATGRIIGNAQTPAPNAPATRVHRAADGGWRLSGHKYYSSGSLYADYIRASAEDESGRAMWAIVATDQAAVRRDPDWTGFGQRTSASGSTAFDDAVVHPLGVLAIDPEVTQHQSYVQLYHLATLTGIVREVVDDAITVNVVRPPRKQAFGDHALDVVGSLYISHATAQALLHASADTLDAANARAHADPEGSRVPYELLSVHTLASQVAVIETALQATTRLFDAAGASLASTERALDRHWRNARTIASHNPVAVKPRLLGDYLVNGRFYASPFAPFDEDGRPSADRAFRPGE